MIFRTIVSLAVLFSVTGICAQRGKNIKLPGQGVRLFYEEAGSGTPIIFIPGWTMTTRFFSKQKKHFSRSHRFLSIDPRSQGNSEKTISGNTYQTHAKDLAEFMKLLDLKNVILVGWSSGCITMFEYLRQFGTNRVKQLLFIDETPKWIGNVNTEWVYGSFDDYRTSLQGLLLHRQQDAAGIIDWMLKYPVDSADKNWMLNEMKKTPDNAALSLYIDGVISDYTDILKKMQAQIPFVFFLRESWHDKAKQWLNKEAPLVNTVRIVSHAMFWERPDEFNRLMTNSLQK